MARVLPLPQHGYRPLRADRPLAIVAELVDGSALGTLVTKARHGTFHSVAVPAPGFGHRRLDNLQDTASLTAAQVITKDGEEARSTANERAGRARKVIVTPAEPLATGCRGTPAPRALAGDRPQSLGG
jgi:chaperonin GroEL